MVLPNKNIFKIGYKIKAFRKANNLTQEQLADKMNCNFKTIGNLENDRTMPDLKQVINLCEVLRNLSAGGYPLFPPIICNVLSRCR